MVEQNTGIDFAVVAYREEGVWQVTGLPTRAAGELDLLVRALRQLPADAWALGMVSVADDFFLMVRVSGRQVGCLLSDVTAATEWALAREAVDFLELPIPDDDEEAQPGGDLGIVEDLGVDAMEMAALCDDIELYPDDMLLRIADRLGFGPAFRRVVDAVSG